MKQALKSGTTLRGGSYRIEMTLGQGGFGITYLALDLNLDRKVAIKEFFPKDYCDRDESTSHVTLGTQSAAEFIGKLKAKFLKEARNIAKFDHPGIIKIHAAFEENNTAYYVMDYIEGESLSEKVRNNGPLSEKTALHYIGKVGDALTYVHSHRINHLDVKPANIMIRRSDDTPILIDFGLSKQYDSTGMQTSTTPTGISHGFAPMEQYLEGGVKEFSPQTDIYSLAATLYFILTGVVPPQAPRLVDEELTFPANFPKNLINPILQATNSKRAARQPSAQSFCSQLKNPNDTNSHKVFDGSSKSQSLNDSFAKRKNTQVKEEAKSDRKFYETDKSYALRKELEGMSQEEKMQVVNKSLTKAILCFLLVVVMLVILYFLRS